MPRPPRDRFAEKYETGEGGCWEWAGARNNDGYGTFWNGERYPGKDGKRGGPVMILAHRWAYANLVDPIPAGLCVLHRCDNPGCVNPEHLFLGTQADNVADCAAKGRRNQARPNRPRVYKKLSAQIHAAIRERARCGERRSDLAREYGVSWQMVDTIVRAA